MNTCGGPGGATRRSFRRAHGRPQAAKTPFEALLGGAPAVFVDTLHILADRLPVAPGVPVAGSFVRLFLPTGTALLPLKATVPGSLSLAATLGTLAAPADQQALEAQGPVGSPQL